MWSQQDTFLGSPRMFRLGLQVWDCKSISGLSVVAVITESHVRINSPWNCWSYAWVQPSPGFRSGFRRLPKQNKIVLCKMLLPAGDDPGADGICYRLQKPLMKPTTPPFSQCLWAAAMKGSNHPLMFSQSWQAGKTTWSSGEQTERTQQDVLLWLTLSLYSPKLSQAVSLHLVHVLCLPTILLHWSSSTSCLINRALSVSLVLTRTRCWQTANPGFALSPLRPTGCCAPNWAPVMLICNWHASGVLIESLFLDLQLLRHCDGWRQNLSNVAIKKNCWKLAVGQTACKGKLLCVGRFSQSAGFQFSIAWICYFK